MSVSKPPLDRLPAPGDRYSREDEAAARRIIDANFLTIAQQIPTLFQAATVSSLVVGTDPGSVGPSTAPILGVGGQIAVKNAGYLSFAAGALYNIIDMGNNVQMIGGGGSGDVDYYMQVSGNIRMRTGGTSDRFLFRSGGGLSFQAPKATVTNAGWTQIGLASNGSLYLLHDQTSGGSAIIGADSSGLTIVAAWGATTFAITATPGATQIGVQFGPAGLPAASLGLMGGSSRTNETVTWAQLQFDW